MTTSDLNDIIREVMDGRNLADPRALMPFVLEQIADHEVADALALCLPAQIQRVIRGRRSSAYRDAPTLSEQSRLIDSAPGYYLKSVEDWLSEAKDAGLLEQRVVVAGCWKFIGDCTSDELRELAKANREQAMANLARAKFYVELADTLDAHGIETLRDAAYAIGAR